MQREIEVVLTGSFVKVQAARDEMQWGDEGPPPLLVKIAPDLSKQDLEDIAAVLKNALFFFSNPMLKSGVLMVHLLGL